MPHARVPAVIAASACSAQLERLLELATGDGDGLVLATDVVELVAQGLQAEAAVLAVAGELTFVGGADRDTPVGQALLAAVTRSAQTPDPAAEATPDGLLVAACRDLHLAVYAAGRAWSRQEAELLSGMARVLYLGRRTRELVGEQQRLRSESEQQVVERDALLASLHEHHALFERLSRIQRSISSRKPLQEVLDAIVAGAADLLGDDIVGLRLVDPADPGYLVVACSQGVPAHLVGPAGRSRTTEGMGGRAFTENRLVLTLDYGDTPGQLAGFTVDGVRTAMAVPVRQGEKPVGSLTVASRSPDRVYSAGEQEVLTAFAEHASLALNDAHAVQSLHRAVEEATRSSLHDPLTGLPNRTLFLTRVMDAAQAQPGAPLTLLFIDLDDFKIVNDSLGHLVGDALLAAVAERIASCTRAPDTVARLGGDEFAVLLPATPDAPAAAIATRVLTALQEPFGLNGQTVHIGASIGLVTALGRRALSSEGGAEELLRDADVAMYHAKAEGKHRCVTFLVAMRDRLVARTELEADLRQALAQDRIVVHYQPVLDARTGIVISTEALVRWQHPERGLVSPTQFVPLAEDTGLIVGIGGAVLREACRQTAAWRRRPELAHLCVSVNLSTRQLAEPGLLREVQEALNSSGLPPCALVLEITESLLVDDLDVALARLHRLKSLGIRLAIDDFGTGYSSLSYLSRLPVDILKVDKAFVSGIADAQGAGRLAAGILALAASLELSTVAEGVETAAQAEALVRQGCTMLQGFRYSRPLPAAQVPAAVAAIAARMHEPSTAPPVLSHAV